MQVDPNYVNSKRIFDVFEYSVNMKLCELMGSTCDKIFKRLFFI